MAGKKFTFTTTRLMTLSCEPGKDRTYYYDLKTPALALCVTGKGARTFYVYRWANGKPVRVKLGSFPGVSIDFARNQAAKVNGKLAEGHDPAAARQELRGEPTFKMMFDEYIRDHAKPKKKSWKQDENQYGLYLSDWEGRKRTAITHEMVRAKHSELGKRHPYAANRLLSLLRKVFNFHKVVPNPATGVARFPEQSRDRFIHRDEVPRFWAALDTINESMRDYFLVCLFTGVRRSNVAAMRWVDVALERCEWRVSMTKSGKPVVAPLTPLLVEILTRRKATVEGAWVFPGRGKTGHLVEPKASWKKLLLAAGLEGVRIHDLRRTLGSWQQSTGASIPVIASTLGNTPAVAGSVYARLDRGEVRTAVLAVEDAFLAATKATTSA